jgi:Coiled-coil region of centrosome protein CE290
MQIMDSYRSAETRITELLKNNRILRDRRAEIEEKIPNLETQVRELEGLVEILRKGSPEADRVAEWGSQAVTGKLDLLALQRRIMGLQEHETYLVRVQAALEATIRRMEEQSIKEELVWEQKARNHYMQTRELERRLIEKQRMDDAAIRSEFEQAKATELPSTSLPLNERLESALRQLEEARKIISTQNSTILTLNTNALALNAKIRTQEDVVLEKDSQIHELNVRMARAAVVEASSLIPNSNTATIPVTTPTASTELRSLQTMYQFACNTIEGLRDMVASKEDSVMRYQQMIVQARETHRRDRQMLEAEVRILIRCGAYIMFVDCN